MRRCRRADRRRIARRGRDTRCARRRRTRRRADAKPLVAFSQVTSPVTIELRAVWGSGPSGVWIGGDWGLSSGPPWAQIPHFDGTSWSRVSADTIASTNAFWGPSPNRVWRASTSEIGEWNGSVWRELVGTSAWTWHAIAGGERDERDDGGRAGPGGASGRRRHRLRRQLVEPRSLLPLTVPAAYYGVCTPDAGTTYWIAGASGYILRYDAGRPTPVSSGTTANLLAIWCRRPAPSPRR